MSSSKYAFQNGSQSLFSLPLKLSWFQAKAAAPWKRISVPRLPLPSPGRPWLWCQVSTHARVKMGPSPLQLRGELYFSSASVSESHFSLQADGDAGGTVQHWQDHLHPLSPRTGISFEKLLSNGTFVTSLFSGLPWHQNRTRTNYRQVEPLESLSLSPIMFWLRYSSCWYALCNLNPVMI